MQAMHFAFNREDLDHLPDRQLLDNYTTLLSQLPDPKSDIIRQHLEDSFLEFYCYCGCHSFLVQPRNSNKLQKLADYDGAYREIAFKTNYDEELNVMLLVDKSGILSQVTAFFGIGNIEPIPNDLVIYGIEGIW